MSKREYVYRHGRRIEVETISDPTPRRYKKRKKFEVAFIQFPYQWFEALQQSNGSAWRLAAIILAKSFEIECSKFQNTEIVLSSALTKMPRHTKTRATLKLVKLGLIHVEQAGNGALRVTRLLKVDGVYKVLA